MAGGARRRPACAGVVGVEDAGVVTARGRSTVGGVRGLEGWWGAVMLLVRSGVIAMVLMPGVMVKAFVESLGRELLGLGDNSLSGTLTQSDLRVPLLRV